MKLGVLKELTPGEQRVAIVPASAAALRKSGWEVLVEQGAGEAAGFTDADYQAAGATVVAGRGEIFEADWIACVRYGASCSGAWGESFLRPGQVLVGLCDPLVHPEGLRAVVARGASAFALELIPRITRAQPMDVLSSMATVAGYRAVLLAAVQLPRFFPMLMTAAGTIRAAKVFVIGAGVAGLQAIATAKRLGAIVSAYDVRPAVREQVESLGARFVAAPVVPAAEDKSGYAKELEAEVLAAERKLLAEIVAESDVVITTAAVPGKPAPKLITADMVERMPRGAVIVDVVADRGGNCELTRPGETYVHGGVTILGPLNLPSQVPYHASQMFSRNMVAFLEHVRKVAVREGRLDVTSDDQIVRETLVVGEGRVLHPAVEAALAKTAPAPAEPQKV
ncbi:MAG: Re/Si-specific NAD(P)(+) transhydrogenase subunit alpha [Thermoguttaceae bacterium]|nr:Re/Si-specific NAD(P)(+) transhydrogenase subunit alpha [Thermoguttaceae bacterium]MDW8077882.1 Re/Si-specific NAD(P)(+) transhydrogenase subunit alpha [Thermoguttaceae bacterium]